MQFRVDENTDHVVITVLRRDTGEVIREIPVKEPFSSTPIFDAIQTGQVIHETLLKPEEKPLQLAFQARELTPPRIRLLPLLAHGGYGLNEADIQAAFAP